MCTILKISLCNFINDNVMYTCAKIHKIWTDNLKEKWVPSPQDTQTLKKKKNRQNAWNRYESCEGLGRVEQCFTSLCVLMTKLHLNIKTRKSKNLKIEKCQHAEIYPKQVLKLPRIPLNKKKKEERKNATIPPWHRGKE